MKIKTGPASVSIKSGGPLGQAVATFSRFNAIDADGDVTLATAFEHGAPAVVSAYGHMSWKGVLPVGAATIHADHEKASASVQFFMDTESGRDTFAVVRQLAELGLGEWSYGYDILDSERGTFEGKPVQFLKRLKVFEISPVLVGAGVRTGTDETKDAVAREYARYVQSLLPGHRDVDQARQLAAHEYARYRRQLAATR